MKELEAKNMGELSITTTPPGATVTIDGEPQMGETPITGLKVKPGSHKLSISAAGYKTKEVEISVTGGKAQEEKFELEAEPEVAPAPVPTPIAPEPTPEPTKPAEKPSKVPAYVTLGVAGAGAIVGTIFGIKALGSKSDYDDNPTADAADDTEQNALIADMAFGVAITLGVTGIVLLTSSGSSEPAKDGNRRLPKRARLNVAPYMSPTGGGAAARWTF